MYLRPSICFSMEREAPYRAALLEGLKSTCPDEPMYQSFSPALDGSRESNSRQKRIRYFILLADKSVSVKDVTVLDLETDYTP